MFEGGDCGFGVLGQKNYCLLGNEGAGKIRATCFKLHLNASGMV